MRLQFLGKYREVGLLLLRVSIGALFLVFVAPVLTGGHSAWSRFGNGMNHFGIHSHLQIWGFLGALLVCFAAILVVFGLFMRLGVLLLLAVAILHAATVAKGSGLAIAIPSIELCIVLTSLLFLGPGKFSVDKT